MMIDPGQRKKKEKKKNPSKKKKKILTRAEKDFAKILFDYFFICIFFLFL